MAKYFLLLSIVVLFTIVNCELNDDLSAWNLTELAEELKIKNDDADCSGMSGTLAKLMEWFTKAKYEPKDPLKINFSLYTRKSPKIRTQIQTGNKFNLNSTDFNIERKTVFILHGFMVHGAEQWPRRIKDAYLEYEDVNVIIVDWARYSFVWNYYKALVNALTVGRQTGEFIIEMTNAFPHKKNWSKIHLVGHSLGAHACGIAGNEIKKLQDVWKVTRITGLDPAQPCFVGTNLLLDKNDAPFVDVIHTNGKEVIGGLSLGLPVDLGDVDIYVNGGHHQPGCGKIPFLKLESLRNILDALREAVCSHMLAIDYFVESLLIEAKKTNVKFWAHKWDGFLGTAIAVVGKDFEEGSCIEMGINANKYHLKGKFFVSAANRSPYSGPLSKSDIDDVIKQVQLDYRHNERLQWDVLYWQ